MLEKDAGVLNLMKYIIYYENSQRSFSKSVNQPSWLDENTLYHSVYKEFEQAKRNKHTASMAWKKGKVG